MQVWFLLAIHELPPSWIYELHPTCASDEPCFPYIAMPAKFKKIFFWSLTSNIYIYIYKHAWCDIQHNDHTDKPSIIEQTLNSQKAFHISPSWASYGMSVVSILWENWLIYNRMILNKPTWFCEKTCALWHSSRHGAMADKTCSSDPTICTISWSDSMPMALNKIATGMSSTKALCLTYRQPFLMITLVLVFFSWVELEN